MLGRTTLQQAGKLVHIRAVSASANLKSSDAVITAPVDKSIWKPTPIPSEIGQDVKDKWYPQVGNRDIVGQSYSMTHDYFDAADAPMPGIRWAPNTPEVLALREKEKNDWKALSLDEKKQLYRNSYMKTFAEIKAPTGNWKRIAYHVFYIFAFGLLYQIYVVKKTRKLEPLYNDVMLEKELVHDLIIGNGPVSGSSTKYDYENNRWK